MKNSTPHEGNATQSVSTGPALDGSATTIGVSRRDLIARLAFYGGAMLLAQQTAAGASHGASGSYGNAAVALPQAEGIPSGPSDDITKAVKIARAMRAGPLQITRDATIAEMDHQGNPTNILRAGSSGWICTPGDENRVGDPPMCVDQTPAMAGQ